MTVADWCRKFF
ncbi:hypothetical protein GWI33_010902, partial [Rhynchophorus ferrugineus]